MKIVQPDLLFGHDIHDVLTYLARTPRAWRYDASETETGLSWDLNLSYADALRASVTGWPEGRAQIKAGVDKIPETARPRRQTCLSVAGYAPHVPNTVMGVPNNMYAVRKTPRHGPPMTLIVNMSANASVPAQCFVNFGIAVAAFVQSVEAANRRIELVVVHSSLVRTADTCTGWIVKHASQPLDLDQLAFAIAHPASFRKIGFALRERLDRSFETPGYGVAQDLTPKMLARLGYPDALVVNAPDILHRCGTAAAAVALLTAQLKDKA
jgi:hypothetical protein